MRQSHTGDDCFKTLLAKLNQYLVLPRYFFWRLYFPNLESDVVFDFTLYGGKIQTFAWLYFWAQNNRRMEIMWTYIWSVRCTRETFLKSNTVQTFICQCSEKMKWFQHIWIFHFLFWFYPTKEWLKEKKKRFWGNVPFDFKAATWGVTEREILSLSCCQSLV